MGFPASPTSVRGWVGGLIRRGGLGLHSLGESFPKYCWFRQRSGTLYKRPRALRPRLKWGAQERHVLSLEG